MERKYELRVLPLFEDDLNEAIDYIAFELNNPEAAERLVSDIESAVLKRLNAPLSFEKYPGDRVRKHDYYRISVRSFSVFYVVIDNTMELRRLLYSKSDIPARLFPDNEKSIT